MGKMEKNVSEAFVTGVQQYLSGASKIYLPSVSIDTVIFSFHAGQLNVLLIRFDNTSFFSLPGGYIKKEEDLDDAALRVLQERTGLKNIYLEQFYTSGKSNRSQEKVIQKVLKQSKAEIGNWLEQRFISVCYYALVDEANVHPTTDPFVTGFKWCDINKLPTLLFDHGFIIEKALQRLQTDLDQKLVGFNLMNETFTMNELQKLYEAVYRKKFVRTNFQRKMLSLGVLKRLDKHYNGKAHKAPYLYKFALRNKAGRVMKPFLFHQ